MHPPTPAAVAASRVPLTPAALASVVGPTRQLARLEVVATSTSTNTALMAAAVASREEWPGFSALVADHQTAGRGRAGRSWATPPGAALMVSVVLRPGPEADLALAPFVAGLATVRALREAGVGAFLKWPNDVVVEAGAKDIPGWGRWRKAVGILCEVVPGQRAVVAGVGINVSQSAAELPVPHAASLVTLGAANLDRAALLKAFVAHLRDVSAAWERDGVVVLDEARTACATVGWDVTVDVPGGAPVSGRAVDLSPAGGLVVETAQGPREILAGDVRVRRA